MTHPLLQLLFVTITYGKVSLQLWKTRWNFQISYSLATVLIFLQSDDVNIDSGPL